MRTLTIKEVTKATKGGSVNRFDMSITGVSTDSRTTKEGDLFTFDGSQF